MPTLLKRVGFTVISLHDAGFAQETQDAVWIAECGRKGWAILSGDKGLQKNPINKAAIIEARCQVFLFTDTNSRAEEWAAAVIMGRRKIARLALRNIGPFYVHIGRESDSHVQDVRFVGTGRAKTSEELERENVSPEPPVIPQALTGTQIASDDMLRSDLQGNLFDR